MEDDRIRPRPRVLVVAGFDQSGGAGVLSDIKTLEAHGVYGYAVLTGLTFQNERSISRISWYSEEEIFEQIDLCFEAARSREGDDSVVPTDSSMFLADSSVVPAGGSRFDWVKIGIGRSIGMLNAIIRRLKYHDPAIKIVLDPVIRASSGKDFWEAVDTDGFDALARQCWLVTPNWDELSWLYPNETVPDVCRRLSGYCHLYLKGGHHPQQPGRDYLWSDGSLHVLEPEVDVAAIYPKHGSGCVLASSLAANLALGYPLMEAAVRSKRYIEHFLTSNKTLLGWHRQQ